MLARAKQSLTNLAKRTLHQVSPSAFRRLRHAYRGHNSYGRLAAALGESLNWTVDSGPFAGMRYLDHTQCRRVAPKLLGAFEVDLHPAIEELIASQPQLVINIGCAEGYYAVGLARRLPAARILAFDCDFEAHALCRELARKNSVKDRITFRGRCEPSDLNTIDMPPGTAIVCDIEGDENELLDPSLVPALKHCYLLVELHEFLEPDLRSTITARFSATHRVQFCDETDRAQDNYPALRALAPHLRVEALNEDRVHRGERHRACWAWLLPDSQ